MQQHTELNQTFYKHDNKPKQHTQQHSEQNQILPEDDNKLTQQLTEQKCITHIKNTNDTHAKEKENGPS